MNCPREIVEYMHKYLDHEITRDEEKKLRDHLVKCEGCQHHFHELKRTTTLVQSISNVQAPTNFASKVMNSLPKEKKTISYKRWFKAHPVFTAAAIFFVLMLSSIVSLWNQGDQLVVSNQEHIVFEDNVVIVPEGKVISGDLVVKNGDLRIEGKVEGDVILINGKLLNDSFEDGDKLKASAGEVTGEIEVVNQVFEWAWYHVKKTVGKVVSFSGSVF
ncbi:anti-sigma factor RsiW [Salirhabdus euzebyi]|uniref:Anti-sigma-W factor RsiW n=1 Tax=Salirhabdus euzebyi TaxID=394506 RepID=A0A841Q6M5_9BACI|nr:zf-HC2 domain-containing protein [Salirhabdus euzebyi]MBB6454004.1 anti-sigma factor RsiW [Salirhabdus euzebyi]